MGWDYAAVPCRRRLLPESGFISVASFVVVSFVINPIPGRLRETVAMLVPPTTKADSQGFERVKRQTWAIDGKILYHAEDKWLT
jgi:hypothetical protein